MIPIPDEFCGHRDGGGNGQRTVGWIQVHENKVGYLGMKRLKILKVTGLRVAE